MKIDREDQRVRITKAMIRQTFLKLLSEKPVQRITVRELCEGAGINRGTFYAHYLDVYDLLEQIENELLEEFRKSIREVLKDRAELSGTTVAGAVFELLKENSELCVILLGDFSNKGIVDKFTEVGKELYLEAYREQMPEVPLAKLEAYYLFVSAGCIALLRRWLIERTEISVEILAETAGRIMTEGIRYLYH